MAKKGDTGKTGRTGKSGKNGLPGKNGILVGPKGDRGEKGDHGQDGKDATITPEIYTGLGSINARLDENDRFHQGLTVQLNHMEETRDSQHSETLKALGDLHNRITVVQTNCANRAGCAKQVEINTGRLDSLDDPKDGVIAQIRNDVTTIKTKLLTYGSLIGGGVIVVGIILKFLGSLFKINLW